MSGNTAQISGQHKFGELAGIAKKTDAAVLIKDLILLELGKTDAKLLQMPLHIFLTSWTSSLHQLRHIPLATTLMGVFSCLGSISPCSHPGCCLFPIGGTDINEVETGIFSLKGRPFLVPPSSVLVGFTLFRVHSFMLQLGQQHNKRLWLIFNRKTHNCCQMFCSITDSI